MKTRKAFVNAAVYLGGGRMIDRGYVICKGSLIEEVGPSHAFARSSDLEISDLGGKLLLPGLTDCHLHLVGYGLSLSSLDLSDTESLEEGLKRIREHAADLPKGVWLRGRGWDKQRWKLKGFPTRQILDVVTPDNPAVLTSRDGHLMWVNSFVLNKFGLDRMAPIEGGEIEVDSKGIPTGILKENAGLVLSRQHSEEERAQAVRAIRAGCDRLASLGLTTVHSVVDAEDVHALDAAAEQGDLGLNVVRLREINESGEIDKLDPSCGARFIKIYGDGALGSQTASMLDAYCGQPENLGIAVTSKRDLRQMVFRSVEKGFSIAVHAIGDRANMEVLDVYEEVRGRSPANDPVLRVEHAQVLRDEDIPRFGGTSAIASMQPIHLVSDMDVAERYWGGRCKNAYAFRSIIAAGGRIAFGSDAPIEDPDPLRGIHAAVTRRDPSRAGSPSWHPAQCLTVAEAVACYTAVAAVAGGIEKQAGSVRPGMRSDFTVLDQNIIAIPDPAAILDTRVAMTVVGGEVYMPS
jgi:predicted amidohydrolase YtcJ